MRSRAATSERYVAATTMKITRNEATVISAVYDEILRSQAELDVLERMRRDEGARRRHELPDVFERVVAAEERDVGRRHVGSEVLGARAREDRAPVREEHRPDVALARRDHPPLRLELVEEHAHALEDVDDREARTDDRR